MDAKELGAMPATVRELAYNGQSGYVAKGGMTIRQRFAMAAMQGYISAGSHGMPNSETIAELAVQCADDTIAELAKETK